MRSQQSNYESLARSRFNSTKNKKISIIIFLDNIFISFRRIFLIFNHIIDFNCYLALNTYLLDQQLCLCFVTYSSQKCQSSYIVTFIVLYHFVNLQKSTYYTFALSRCKVDLKHEESPKNIYLIII